jgi:hypothetical protein
MGTLVHLDDYRCGKKRKRLAGQESPLDVQSPIKPIGRRKSPYSTPPKKRKSKDLQDPSSTL